MAFIDDWVDFKLDDWEHFLDYLSKLIVLFKILTSLKGS